MQWAKDITHRAMTPVAQRSDEHIESPRKEMAGGEAGQAHDSHDINTRKADKGAWFNTLHWAANHVAAKQKVRLTTAPKKSPPSSLDKTCQPTKGPLYISSLHKPQRQQPKFQAPTASHKHCVTRMHEKNMRKIQKRLARIAISSVRMHNAQNTHSILSLDRP